MNDVLKQDDEGYIGQGQGVGQDQAQSQVLGQQAASETAQDFKGDGSMAQGLPDGQLAKQASNTDPGEPAIERANGPAPLNTGQGHAAGGEFEDGDQNRVMTQQEKEEQAA